MGREVSARDGRLVIIILIAEGITELFHLVAVESGRSSIAATTVSHPGTETVQTTREGTIVGWKNDKGFGWVEIGGKRLFSHIHDFVERMGKVPAILIGVKGVAKASSVSGEIAARLMEDVWKIFGIKAPPRRAS